MRHRRLWTSLALNNVLRKGKEIRNHTSMKHLLRAVLLPLSLAISSADAQTIFTNFHTHNFNTNVGYESTFSIDGQPNYPSGAWQSSDPYNPNPAPLGSGETSLVQFFNFVTLGAPQDGNNSVLFGGYGLPGGRKPGITNPSIYFSFAQGTSDILGESVTFRTDFSLWRPTPMFFSDDDVFGITLWDSFGSNALASFSFNPNAAFVTNPASQYGIEWYRDGVQQTNIPPLTATNWVLGASALYRFEAILQGSAFDLNIYALSAQTNNSGVVTNFAVVQSVAIVQSGALASGFSAADFGSVSYDWELASGNPADPGGNYFVINQATVLSTVIPEPGTWAAGVMLLGGALIALRRRAARAQVAG